MSPILLDTDILIDHLRGHRRLDLDDLTLSISVVTRCELFAGRNVNETELHKTLDAFQEIPVDPAIAETAGRIRRDTNLAVADALIAATALSHAMTVRTRNRRHFQKVPNLQLCDTPD